MDDANPLIFISYTTADRERVLPFFDYLDQRKFDLWMDYKKIKPGQNWDFEIKRALTKASVIILFISENSVSKRGYVQKEIKFALDRLEEKLVDDIYLIPVLLDDNAQVPEQVKSVQFTKASSGTCESDIEDSIRHQLKQLGENIQTSLEKSNLSWSKHTYKDVWDGIPGVEIEFQVLRFRSIEYPKIADITDYIKGFMTGQAMDFRMGVLDPMPEDFNYGQERHRRTHSFDASCGEPHIVGKIMSLSYGIHTYYARAAHPNMQFQTFAFMLDPLIRIPSLQSIFSDVEQAFAAIQSEVRKQLSNHRGSIAGNEEVVIEPDIAWIEQGTEDWDDFASYMFIEEGIEFLFSPYQVGCYAEGPAFATIPYNIILQYVKRQYISALDKEFEFFYQSNQ